MLAHKTLLTVVIFLGIGWSASDVLGQIRIVTPPVIPQLPPVRVITPHLDTNLRGSLPVTPLPRLDTTIPSGAPTLRVEHPSSGRETPPSPQPQPNYQVKDPPAPAPPPPDAGDTPAKPSNSSLPVWLIWVVLGVAFFLYLSRKER